MTLVIDTGQSIIGVYCVEEGKYIAYRGSEISDALERIKNADEVVTYNGERRDLLDLARFAGLDADFPLNGKHTDMLVMCWAPILGSNLIGTFERHFPTCSEFPFGCSDASDEYEADNQRDVFMTLKLWELWKLGKLDLPGDGYLYH